MGEPKGLKVTVAQGQGEPQLAEDRRARRERAL